MAMDKRVMLTDIMLKYPDRDGIITQAEGYAQLADDLLARFHDLLMSPRCHIWTWVGPDGVERDMVTLVRFERLLAHLKGPPAEA